MDLNNLTFDTSKCFINGAWVEPENGKMLDLVNPSNGEFLCKIARGTIKDINKAVYAAQRVPGKSTPPSKEVGHS